MSINDGITTYVIGGLASWWTEISETVLAGVVGAVCMAALIGGVIALAAL